MSSGTKKSFCLMGLKKLNLCNKTKKNSDYDYAPYENSQKEPVNFLENVQPKQHKFLKKQSARVNLLSHYSDFIKKPDHHSTKMESTIELSNNPVIMESEFEPDRVASTFMQKSSMTICTNEPELSTIDETNLEYDSQDLSSNAYSNESYASPAPTSQYSSSLGFSQTYSSFSLDESDSIDAAEVIYACCVSYQAQLKGDLSLKFSERVKLIHQEESFSLVQNLHTKTCGYVPTYCICKLSSFLRDLKHLHQ